MEFHKSCRLRHAGSDELNIPLNQGVRDGWSIGFPVPHLEMTWNVRFGCRQEPRKSISHCIRLSQAC